MIEAVNMSVSTAQLARSSGASAAASSIVAPPAPDEFSVGISAPYLSPHVNLNAFKKPIFIVRDLETGQALRQFPSEAQIRAYQRAQEVQTGQNLLAEKLATRADVDVNIQAQTEIVENSVQFKQARAEIKAAQPVAVGGGGQTAPVDRPAPQPVGNTGSLLGSQLNAEA